MFDPAWTETAFFSLVAMPVLIFLARVLDVSLGTIRLIFIARGMRVIAPLIGFFEILIWVVAIGQIMQNLTSWIYYIAYAGGFAAGTWVGMWIENKIAVGIVSVRVITRTDASALVADLRENDYGVTSLLAEGATGSVRLLYTLVSRQDLPDVLERVKRHNPHAFYAVEDIRFVRDNTFSVRRYRVPSLHLPHARGRKGK